MTILPAPQGLGIPAEWWQRALAVIIDLLVLGVFVWVSLLLASWTQTLEGIWNLATPLVTAVAFIAQPVYFIGHHGLLGQTVGKASMRIYVCDELTGEPIGLGRAFLRWLVPIVMTAALYLPGLLNLLWPLWDEKRQALHDKTVKSLVLVGDPVAGNLFDVLKKHGGYDGAFTTLDQRLAGNKPGPNVAGTRGGAALRGVIFGVPLLALALYWGFADRRPDPPGHCSFGSNRNDTRLSCLHEDIHSETVRDWLWDHDYDPNGWDFPHPAGLYDHTSHDYDVVFRK